MLQYSNNGRFGPWTLVNIGLAARIDGGDPNLNTHVLLAHTRGEDGITPHVAWATAINRSGSCSSLGIGVRISKSLWKAGGWTDSTTTFTNRSTEAKSTGGADFPLETTTNNDGYIVTCRVPFNAISHLVSAASTGSPARAIQYSRPGGTWSTLATPISWFGAANNYTVGENTCWFTAPSDWVPLEAGHGTGVPVGEYGIRIRATTAPTVAGVAHSLSVHSIMTMGMTVAASGKADLLVGGLYLPLMPYADAIVGCLSSDAASTNFQALVRIRG